MLSSEHWLDLKRIASEALGLPAASRPDYLARSCPDALRADVEQLLRSCERVSSTPTFLDTPATEFAAPIIANVEQNPIDLVALRAELAGRYTIERELGRGGMATVYLAHDERHRRRVALKVVHSGPAHLARSSAARFQREIEIAARLTHPHILPLHDSGAAADCLYYVMPFVSGESLRERIARSGPLSLEDALRLLRDVARVLAYAHREGIVHRDIKPGNILLNQDGDALVADFGIASALAAARGDGVAEHSADLAFGTPAYSAPEQLRGERDADQRADLYSLGVTSYEALCGTRPVASQSTPEVLGVQQTLMTRRPDVPPALAALVERLLARDPADRPQDAGEVLRALDAVSTPTKMANSPSSARRPVRRRIVALASVISFALVGMFGLNALRAHSDPRMVKRGTHNLEARSAYERGTDLTVDSPRPANLLAARPFFERAVQLDPEYAEAWAGLASVYTYQAIFDIEPPDDVIGKAQGAVKRALELDSTLAEAHWVRAHQLFVLECRADDAAREFERTLVLDSTQGRGTYALLLHFSGHHDSALAQLHRARSMRPTVAGSEALLGRVFVNTHQPDSAIFYLRKAVTFRRDLWLAYQQLAFAWLEKNKKDSAIAAMRHAAEWNGRDSAQLAYIYAKTGRRAAARRIMQRLVNTESRRKLPSAGMAMAYAALGNVDEAFRRLEEGRCDAGLGESVGYESLRSDPRFPGLLRRKGLVGRAHSDATIVERGTNNDEAWQAYERGTDLANDPRPEDLQRALLLFDKAIRLDPNFARAWAGLANVYIYRGVLGPDPATDERAKAERAVKRALELDSNLVEANAVRAHLLFLECRADDAEKAFKRTFALDSTYAQAHQVYGLFLHFTARHDSALAHLRRARKLGPRVGSETLLGRVFVNTNKPDSAILYLRNALSFKPDLNFAYQQLAFAWLEKDMKDSAIAAMRHAAELNRRDSAQLAYIYVKTGKPAEARRIIQRLDNAKSQRRLRGPGMAMAYAALGNVDEAFRRLEAARCIPGLRVGAGFESLRLDPRFADLLRRKGLPLLREPRNR